MSLNNVQKVYFIGIGGIGISGLAMILNWQNKHVLGSDLQETELTKELVEEGIGVLIGQKAEQVPEDADLYIYSAAVPEDNPERARIKELGLQDKEMSYFEAVGELMKDYDCAIAISGTHGKTTTTAMLAEAMVEAGLDPTVIVGSKVKQLGSNARLGKDKKYFVVEACEYKEHMLKLNPKVILLTNIEEDHLDYYRDLEHIEMSFQEYINKLSVDKGLLVKNADDSECKNLGYDGQIISYGIEQGADAKVEDIIIKNKKQVFKVNGQEYTLQIPGKFNIYNALAVIAFLRDYLKLDEEVIKKAIANFKGTWRRFEVIGEYRGAKVISDYAHHPTAVEGVIKAAKEFYPDQRIFVVFQPHQHNRTKKLFNQFVGAFTGADFIIIQEIYGVAGREENSDQDVSGKDLKEAIEATGKYVFYAEDLKKSKALIDEHLEKNDVLLIVGAGDIYKLGEELK